MCWDLRWDGDGIWDFDFRFWDLRVLVRHIAHTQNTDWWHTTDENVCMYIRELLLCRMSLEREGTVQSNFSHVASRINTNVRANDRCCCISRSQWSWPVFSDRDEKERNESTCFQSVRWILSFQQCCGWAKKVGAVTCFKFRMLFIILQKEMRVLKFSNSTVVNACNSCRKKNSSRGWNRNWKTNWINFWI